MITNSKSALRGLLHHDYASSLRRTMPVRCFASVALNLDTLRPLEDSIAKGLRLRLRSLEYSSRPCVVAVAGTKSLEFAAALRAVRAAGATVVPLDVQGRSPEEVRNCLAEARAQLTVAAGISCTKDAAVLRDASHFIGAEATTAQMLYELGDSASDSAADTAKQDSPSVLLLSDAGVQSVRAAEVHHNAMQARVKTAAELWRFTAQDRVVSLGLRSDCPAALVETLEAPLSVGATVNVWSPRSMDDQRVWDFWTIMRQDAEATVAFVGARWCWKLLDAYASLAAPVRAEFAERWAKKPLRHTVAVAPPQFTQSTSLSQQWQEVFKCPLTLLYSCAEAGSLYTSTAGQERRAAAAPPSDGECKGIEWQIGDGGELLVRGETVFAGYQGRSRLSAEAFTKAVPTSMDDPDGGSSTPFVRTGHIVSIDAANGALLSSPATYDTAIERDTERYLKRGPGLVKELMKPEWHIQKVPIRVYRYWRSKKGYRVYTKKHNNVHMVYTSKYK